MVAALRRYFYDGPLVSLRSRRIDGCPTFGTASAALHEMSKNTHSLYGAVDDLDCKDQRRQDRVTKTDGFKKAQRDLRLKGVEDTCDPLVIGRFRQGL